MSGPFDRTVNILRDKFKDAGYPYFYSGRPVKRPYFFRNPIIGKALAGDFLYPFRFVQSIQARFRMRSTNLYAEMYPSDFVDKFLAGEEYPLNNPFENYDATKRDKLGLIRGVKSEAPKTQDLRKTISIWRYSDLLTQNDGGKPLVKLDFIPDELAFNVPSQLKSLGVIGRNYPRYHYVGGEETLSFKISWYDFGDDALNTIPVKCRKLEAMSKAGGYKLGPRLLYIAWGAHHHWTDETKLLSDRLYVIQSANYKLMDFTYRRRIYEEATDTTEEKREVRFYGMFPVRATQELVLKRIAGQLTATQIARGFN